MKGLAVLILVVVIATVAFMAGKKTSSSNASTAAPTVSVQPKPTGPSSYERELMSSLNAIQSGVQTGINQMRYSELIANARTKLADLRLNAAMSPLVEPTSAYLDAHAKVLAIWQDHYSTNEDRVYVTLENEPELYAFVGRALPGTPHVEMNKPNHTYAADEGLGRLWGYTERKMRAPILAGWQTLNGG